MKSKKKSRMKSRLEWLLLYLFILVVCIIAYRRNHALHRNPGYSIGIVSKVDKRGELSYMFREKKGRSVVRSVGGLYVSLNSGISKGDRFLVVYAIDLPSESVMLFDKPVDSTATLDSVYLLPVDSLDLANSFVDEKIALFNSFAKFLSF